MHTPTTRQPERFRIGKSCAATPRVTVLGKVTRPDWAICMAFVVA